MKGLNKVRLVDAGFVWTEPHSKRIKVSFIMIYRFFFLTILYMPIMNAFIILQENACTYPVPHLRKESLHVNLKLVLEYSHPFFSLC